MCPTSFIALHIYIRKYYIHTYIHMGHPLVGKLTLFSFYLMYFIYYDNCHYFLLYLLAFNYLISHNDIDRYCWLQFKLLVSPQYFTEVFVYSLYIVHRETIFCYIKLFYPYKLEQIKKKSIVIGQQKNTPRNKSTAKLTGAS